MENLSSFSARIAAELQAADGPSVDRDHEAEFMTRVSDRTLEFDRQSNRLVAEIIRPRMEALAGFFANASPARKCDPGRCCWWFGYTERFPASVKLELSVDHDMELENLVISYELTILPVYTKYQQFDRFTMPFEQIDDARLIEWLEARLIKFVRTYVIIENSNQDQTTSLVTDPVCGMRVVRESAVAELKHSGHSYFFCSRFCRDAFEQEPARYARLVMA